MPTTSKRVELFGLPPAHDIAVLQGLLFALPVIAVDGLRQTTSTQSAWNVVSLPVMVIAGAVKTTLTAQRQVD